MADGTAVTPTATVLSNITSNSSTPTTDQVAKVIGWLTFSLGLPAIGLAIYTLQHLAKGQNRVPIYIVSLLVSDILSFLGRPQTPTETVLSSDVTNLLFYFGIVSNITFMVCIAQDCHLLVAYPQCHGCCSTLRQSALVSLIVWAVPFGVLALAVLKYYFWFAVALLTPFPFLLFFSVDSWRALLCSRSTPRSPERTRMVWGLGVILANYTLLYVPFILNVLLESLSFKEEVRYLGLVSHLMLYLSPLVDPFLYIFMTKGPREVMDALPCCKKRQQTEDRRSTVDTVAEVVETRL
ncbi:lysophosphatidic acid receptor 6-like [Myripristis murdjan]|uniref:lysophosphatidic acid receptor 6-like n=1 Tax=Myripristis murdjan TaxID=586833 RepID=UPI001175D21C|nr:lysophosphatidic acid receptor 6-like [Myripristis murdjan]